MYKSYVLASQNIAVLKKNITRGFSVQGFSYGRITDDTVHFSFTDDPMIIRMVLFTDDPMIILMVLSTDDPMIKFRFFCRILQAIR